MTSLINIYQPYTYLIGWSSLNKWYYGVRYAKNCNPKDLWVTYFTSSLEVKKFRELYGEPDIVKVRKIFNNPKDAKIWEDRVLIKVSKYSDMWLNRRFGSFPGFIPNEQSIKNMSDALRGKKRSIESIEKQKKTLKDKNLPIDWGRVSMLKLLNTGKVKSAETKLKISTSLTGRKLTSEHAERIAESKLGKNRVFSDDHKENIKLACSKRHTVTMSCVHCKKIFNAGNFAKHKHQ